MLSREARDRRWTRHTFLDGLCLVSLALLLHRIVPFFFCHAGLLWFVRKVLAPGMRGI